MRDATSLNYNFVGASKGSFNSSRLPIKFIVIHSMDGTFDGTRGWFNNATRPNPTSAHYGLSLDGRIDQYVKETQTAYHAGNYPINQQSIGIECEDGGDNQSVRTDTLYTTAAKLIFDICQFYKLPIDKTTVKLHREIKATSCPGSLNVDRIIAEANDLAQAESKKVMEIAPDVFDRLVKKSNSFDHVWKFLSLPESDVEDPKAFEKVTNYITTLQMESVFYKRQAELNLEAKNITPDRPPQVVPELPNPVETITKPLEISTPSKPLLDELLGTTATVPPVKINTEPPLKSLLLRIIEAIWG